MADGNSIWGFQVVGIPLMIVLGIAAKAFVGMLWNLENVGITGLIAPVTIPNTFYLLTAMAIIWQLPWLIGAERRELEKLL